MYVVMVSSECAPVCKVGGLGDVVAGLARELEIRGNAVEIILPKYDCMRYDQIWGLTPTVQDLYVPWYNGAIRCTVYFGFVHGRKCFFIDPHSDDQFFNRGAYYGFSDETERFAFFSKAALEFMLKTDKRPDIIHTHDWQTGLLPVMLYEIYKSYGMENQRVCHTIHNFRHQGTDGETILTATGLGRPSHFIAPERLEDDFHPGAINFTKSAIVYSNFVTTVSPHHAWEAHHSDQGFGLGGTLHRYRDKFGGILNGLDYDVWNPSGDRHIPYAYDVSTVEVKYKNKEALRNRFWLEQNDKPIISYVGRLDTQKGLHLVRHAIFYALRNHAQFVLLGTSPEKEINDSFWSLKVQLNDSPDCHLEIAYDEELAHVIYAGSDMVIVPSVFEPCGLPQMIGMRYGTIPVVRAVGGLSDTVFDVDYSERSPSHRNGFVFDHNDHEGIESALKRAIYCWYKKPKQFRKLMINGMKSDYSWNHPGRHYTSIYEHIRHK